MTERRDDPLRKPFQELREETRRPGRVPDFGATMREAERRAERLPALEVVAGGADPARRRRRGLMRLGAWASAAVAAAVGALILVDRGPGGDEEFERLVAAYADQGGGVAWSSPTSGLLEVPGIDLMRSVPSIGVPARGIDPARSPAPRPSSQEENS